MVKKVKSAGLFTEQQSINGSSELEIILVSVALSD
jgi:hypothetical protein